MAKLFHYPLAPLLLFSVALTVLLVTYVVAGLMPSPTFEYVASFFGSMLLALWVVADARRKTGVPCFDFGFFCYMFLPLAVPWYCFWSRGLRGLLMLAALVVLWLAPYLVAAVFWLAIYA
jgi:hypothetical protein